MYYYKGDNEICASVAILPLEQITKEEYDAIVRKLQLAREALDKELEREPIDSLLAGDTVVIK